jgi:TIR domain-containing protein
MPQFEGFDTHQMMKFLYENIAPKKEDAIPTEIRKPKQSDAAVPPINNRTKVFISYSHENNEELQRLLIHLRAAKQNNMIEWWDDTQIKPGEMWHEEIKNAVASTRVAILLVSVDYLASEFILKNELPPLLTASEEEGITILPVILGPCGFKHTNLARFQAVNDPSIPLSKMNRYEKDEVWNKVVETILDPDNS